MRRQKKLTYSFSQSFSQKEPQIQLNPTRRINCGMNLCFKKWWHPFFIFSLVLTHPLLCESSYQDEINAIRLRTATLIDHGRERINQLGQFKNAWASVGFYTSELSELTQIRMDLQNYSGGTSLFPLHVLTFEKVLIDTLQVRLDHITTKIEEALQAADNIVAQYSDIDSFQNPLKNEILTNLHELSETLNARKAQSDANLGIWYQWQMTVALQAEIAHQGSVVSDLALYNDIGQVRVIFNRLWLDTLHKTYERDFHTARQLLTGYSWFKSTIRLYFADKLTTQDQADFLNDILNEAQEKETELTTHCNLLSSPVSWHIFAEAEGEHEGSGEREGEDHEGREDDSGEGDFPKSSGDVIEVAKGMDPGTHREFRIENLDGTAMAVLSVSKGVCKYDEAGNGSAKITAEGSGFVEHDPEHNPVEKTELPSGPELQKAVDRNLQTFSFNLSGSIPCGPKPADGTPDIRDQSDKLGHMIDHAQSKATKEEDKEGLLELKNELQKFNNYHDHLNDVIRDRIDRVKHAQNMAKSKSQGLAKSLPPAPSKMLPPSLDPSHILDQLNRLRQTIWNWALSTGGSLSQSLGDFIQGQSDQAPAPLQGPAKQVLEAARGRSKPTRSLPKLTYAPMTPEIRQAILKNAKALRDGSKIIKYSQANRLGPDSYDCSGFVSSMYAAAGLPFGSPNVKQTLSLAGPNGPFKEVSLADAERGDLIIWKKGEGENTYDHVAIYDGEQTVHNEKAPAVISTSSAASSEGRNAIQEILIKDMMGDKDHPVIHVFKWFTK